MTTVRHTTYMTIRHLRELWRQPWFVAVTLVQPVIWLLLFGTLFKKVIEIPGRGVQIDLLCQALDQRIDFVPLLVDEPLCIRFDVLHFACRRNIRQDFCGQTACLFTIETGLLTVSKRVEPVIKSALEPIHSLRIERCEAFLPDKLIKPVLPFDQELQPPYSVFHIKGEEIMHPRRTSVSGLYFKCQTLAVRILVDDLLADSPGIDNFGHYARERRECRYPSQLEDQLGAEGAHGSKLEANIGLIGKTCVGGDM